MLQDQVVRQYNEIVSLRGQLHVTEGKKNMPWYMKLLWIIIALAIVGVIIYIALLVLGVLV